MPAINPFDACDLENYTEASHVLKWYAGLSDAMKQKCVDTIIDTKTVMDFIKQAITHIHHELQDFDSAALTDLQQRLSERKHKTPRKLIKALRTIKKG